MPVAIDIVFTVWVLVASVYDHVYFWPRFRAAVAAGRPGTRVRVYLRGMSGQWLGSLGVVAIWILEARRWSALGLTLPHGWRLAVAIAVVLAAVGFLLLQVRQVMGLAPETRVALRPSLGDVTFLMPHTAAEARWWVGVSLTAGWCEELLFRGYLVWVFAPWLGTVGAMMSVVIAFGLGHAYQGRQGVIKATVAGAVMATIVLASGSLIPAMIAHALIDIGGGMVGYGLLRETGSVTSAGIVGSGVTR